MTQSAAATSDGNMCHIEGPEAAPDAILYVYFTGWFWWNKLSICLPFGFGSTREHNTHSLTLANVWIERGLFSINLIYPLAITKHR